MPALLFSSNYPGPHAPFWQYFGAALNHLVLALYFAAFLVGSPSDFSIRSYFSDLKARGYRRHEADSRIETKASAN